MTLLRGCCDAHDVVSVAHLPLASSDWVPAPWKLSHGAPATLCQAGCLCLTWCCGRCCWVLCAGFAFELPTQAEVIDPASGRWLTLRVVDPVAT